MNKLAAFLLVLRRGSVVADPARLKNQGALTAAIAAFIMALVQLAKAYGYELPIDDGKASALAGGIAVLVLMYVNYASSDKVGLPPKREPLEAPGDAAQPDDRP